MRVSLSVAFHWAWRDRECLKNSKKKVNLIHLWKFTNLKDFKTWGHLKLYWEFIMLVRLDKYICFTMIKLKWKSLCRLFFLTSFLTTRIVINNGRRRRLKHFKSLLSSLQPSAEQLFRFWPWNHIRKTVITQQIICAVVGLRGVLNHRVILRTYAISILKTSKINIRSKTNPDSINSCVTKFFYFHQINE